jgi:hypothetical protein
MARLDLANGPVAGDHAGMEILTVIVLWTILALAAVRLGADSREGFRRS